MTRRMMAAAVLSVGLAGTVIAVKANPVGSFSLEQVAPKAGDPITFAVDVTGLPENGGASVAPWVELTCGSVYEDLQAAATPITQNTSNPTRAYFTLSSAAWSAAGFTAQDCEAYLFYDGYNGPRRRKANTLAALFFSVAAAP